jgi:DNA polymerase (family 10)
MSNAEVADKLASFGQLLSSQPEKNPYKVRAYQKAAALIRVLPASLDEMVRQEVDLTGLPGVGEAIADAIREIVLTGSLGRLESLRAQSSPELARINDYPRLDPKRVLRVYKKLNIASIEGLRDALDAGLIEQQLGVRMAQHVRQALMPVEAMLLYKADALRASVEEFLVGPCDARRVEVAGGYRRRTEVVDELTFLVEAEDFAAVVRTMQSYGGETPLVRAGKSSAAFGLSAGIVLRLRQAYPTNWGLSLIACTGSMSHLRKLSAVTGSIAKLRASGDAFPDEESLYAQFGLGFIAPELREGLDEVRRAQMGTLPALVSVDDIRGELHAHSLSSDGSNSIEQMAATAQMRGYEYLGITDHSQSLKIAGGVSPDDLWKQVRYIDRLNERLSGIRILKSSEVDILQDGSLDYPDDLLKELDYTVCSIHSRFGLGKEEQTERIMRAMDNRYFNILGHATGRLLLKRPGYEIDVARVVMQARQNGCFFEINSSPDRLDLSAENARMAGEAGVKIAVSTDAHSVREFGLVRYGIDQARRAGLEKSSVLNCLPLEHLSSLFRR